jgi:hypothetical protein
MGVTAIIHLEFFVRSRKIMGESHVVSALVNKRAEMAGIIARTEQQLGQFRADLVHLDAAIRLFAPGLEPKSIPAKKVRQSDGWFEQGELSRRVLDALRRAGQPMRAPDVVRVVMVDKGLDPADRSSFARVQWKVRDTLGCLNKRGLLVSDGVRCLKSLGSLNAVLRRATPIRLGALSYA